MKNLKGIFEACSEELSPDVADKSKVIGDMMMFRSGELNKLDRNKNLNIEDMELPYEGISFPLDSPIASPSSNDLVSKISNSFDLPGFSKEDMMADTGEFFKDAIGEDLEERGGGKNAGDRMNIDNARNDERDLTDTLFDL